MAAMGMLFDIELLHQVVLAVAVAIAHQFIAQVKNGNVIQSSLDAFYLTPFLR